MLMKLMETEAAWDFQEQHFVSPKVGYLPVTALGNRYLCCNLFFLLKQRKYHLYVALFSEKYHITVLARKTKLYSFIRIYFIRDLQNFKNIIRINTRLRF